VGAAIRGLYVRWAIYGLIFSLFGPIDMAAHVGGLVAGFGVGYLAGMPRLEGSASERVWRILAWVCVLATAVGFLDMYSAFTKLV
jgi:membrane associated rhomboid family serine protease